MTKVVKLWSEHDLHVKNKISEGEVVRLEYALKHFFRSYF